MHVEQMLGDGRAATAKAVVVSPQNQDANSRKSGIVGLWLLLAMCRDPSR